MRTWAIFFVLLFGACSSPSAGDDLLGDVKSASGDLAYDVYATTDDGYRAVSSDAPTSIDFRVLTLSDGATELTVADAATREHLDLVLDEESRVMTISGALGSSRARLEGLASDLATASNRQRSAAQRDSLCSLTQAAVTLGCAARVAISASGSARLVVDTPIATCVKAEPIECD